MLSEILIVLFIMSLFISYFAIKEDRVSKGYKANARDGDKDGIIQEGTRWERKARKK